MHKNITLLYWNSCLMWSRFFIPVIALFYVASQVSLDQFSIIFAVFTLTMIILEVPSGVIADLLGKKKTLIAAGFFFVSEVVILAFFNGFFPLLLAKILSGVGVSLTSGTREAILFDTLKKIKKVKEHKRISGLLHTYANITMAFVFIVGAWLFTLHPKLPALLTIPPITLGWILYFFLEEPFVSKKKVNLINALNHFKKGFAYAFQNKKVLLILLVSMPTMGLIAISQSLSSAYFEEIKVPIAIIGVIAFCASMVSAYTSKITYKIDTKWGFKKSFSLVYALLGIGLCTMALMLPLWGIFFYAFIAAVWGMDRVLVNHYINIRIPSSHRATMISVNNFFRSVFHSATFFGIGVMLGLFSLQVAYATMTIILVIYTLIFLILQVNLKLPFE